MFDTDLVLPSSLIINQCYLISPDETKNSDYLRLGRENNNGYIRFGRNEPFLRFGKKNDPFLRIGKQDPFLRFGRQDPFLRFGREDPYLRFGRNDPYLRFGRNDPYLRFGRNDPYLRFGRSDPYLRFGRSDPYLRFGRNDPYLRFGRSDPFLRFGKSADSDVESDVDSVTLSREHGFAEENETSDRRKRSVNTEEGNGAQDNSLSRETREVAETGTNDKNVDSKLTEEAGAREVRSGHYMRFGKKNDVDADDLDNYDRSVLESEFSRFLRSYGNRLSLPRFGKRRDHSAEKKQEYMRFGRAAEEI